MRDKLKKKDFLTFMDFTREEINDILNVAYELKMTDEIIEGSHSVVWDQAENRMHTEKAVLALFVG